MALPNLGEGGRLTRSALLGAAVLGGVILPVGCGAPTGPLDDDVYVEVMSQLSYAHARYIDPARADSARRAVIETAGVSPDDLRAFVDFYGENTDKMFLLAERIRLRVDSLNAIDRGALGGTPEVPPDGEPPDPDGNP